MIYRLVENFFSMNKLQKNAYKILLGCSRELSSDRKGRLLSRGAFEFGVFALSSLTRNELKEGGWNQIFPSLAVIGESFSNFFDGEPMPANRVEDALIELEAIGLLGIKRVDSTALERENYGYSSTKQVWHITLDLHSFVEK